MAFKPVRVGILGAGFVAELHAGILREMGAGVEVVAIAARTRARAEALAARHGIGAVLPDVESLLARADVDLVDLCVPNYAHAECALLAAQAGKHFVCHKPLTGYFGGPDAADPVGATPRRAMLQGALASADAMLAAAEANGVQLLYAENLLYAPAISKAKRLIRASGGAILELRAEESHHGSHSPYARQWQYTGGGALIRMGSHPIGVALHLKACEGQWRDGQPIRVASVLAQTANLGQAAPTPERPAGWVARDWQDVENWSTAILTFTDGTRAVISANDVCVGGMRDTLDLFMSNARIHCDLTRNSLLQAYAPVPEVFAAEYLNEKLETKAGWSFPSVSEAWALGYQDQLRDFVEAVRDERPPLSDGALGREVVNVIYHAYLSAEAGRVVHLE
jgi:predicted dehydrogenase